MIFKISRRRIGRIMQQRGLNSTYAIAHFKTHTSAACNDNVLARTFTQDKPLEAIVIDLTSVRVGKK